MLEIILLHQRLKDGLSCQSIENKIRDGVRERVPSLFDNKERGREKEQMCQWNFSIGIRNLEN